MTLLLLLGVGSGGVNKLDVDNVEGLVSNLDSSVTMAMVTGLGVVQSGLANSESGVGSVSNSASGSGVSSSESTRG